MLESSSRNTPEIVLAIGAKTKTFHATGARNDVLFDEVDDEIGRHQPAEARHEGFCIFAKKMAEKNGYGVSGDS